MLNVLRIIILYHWKEILTISVNFFMWKIDGMYKLGKFFIIYDKRR